MPGRRTARKSGRVARRSARRVSRKVSRRSAKKSGRVTRGSAKKTARRVSRRARRNTRRNVRRVRRSVRQNGGMLKAFRAAPAAAWSALATVGDAHSRQQSHTKTVADAIAKDLKPIEIYMNWAHKMKNLIPDGSDDSDESTTLTSSTNRSRKEDAEYIRELEAKLAAATVKANASKPSRRQSVTDVGAELHGRMIYSLTEVKKEEEKIFFFCVLSTIKINERFGTAIAIWIFSI